MKYEVQHYTLCDGWINTWIVSEGGIETPHIFDSKEEAQAELDEFFEDIEAEIKRGERATDEGYSKDEFRINAIKEGD